MRTDIHGHIPIYATKASCLRQEAFTMSVRRQGLEPRTR